MTTMAVTPPYLGRLFERLDFAPNPADATLASVLERWRAARGRNVAPPLTQIAANGADLFESAFVYRRLERENDYRLVAGEKAVEPLLGPASDGKCLSEAKNPRGAVRLRRLFEEVRRKGEPALAEFTLVEKGRDLGAVELIAAPLAEPDGTIDAVLGAVSIRPFAVSAPARPARARSGSSPMLFALGSSRELGEKIAAKIGVDLAPVEEREFEDGEHKTRPLASVRGRDVYVVCSLHGEAKRSGADKLVRLLFFIGALRDAGAARVTAVVPYLCYARKDRRTKPRDPVASRYVAQMFEAVGTDRVITIDAHNVAAYENAFRIPAEALDAQAIFARYFVAKIGAAPVAVVSPDLGGEKRAELFRERLERALSREVGKGFMEKRRSMGRVSGEIFAGDVLRRTVVILDDLIAGGGTMARAAAACRAHGAARIWLAATHGLFSRGFETALGEAPVDEIVVTDTIAPPPHAAELLHGRLVVLGIADLLARAIERCHEGGSLTELSETGP
jgi:ribose-phosphate pyrophosphokinase